ncbi:MAG: YigZ family protein [Bacteroidota bacterium]
MQIFKYRSLKGRSEGTYKEKGSKFIALAEPCYSETEAKELLLRWKKEHAQASHLCYAYRLGLTSISTRANDDGEPNNSAGIPILGQIQSFDLNNVLVGVVRYYGGTKLGVGGLIIAYKSAAKIALEAAEIIEKEVCERFLLEFSYNEVPQVMNLIKQRKLEFSNSDFSLECKLWLDVPLEISTNFKQEVKDMNNIQLTSLGIN